MYIGNVTAGQISTLVWTAATRTLTADPATDAGAATLVWTHATRTLTADPATDAGAATLVWGHTGRSLNTAISSPTVNSVEDNVQYLKTTAITGQAANSAYDNISFLKTTDARGAGATGSIANQTQNIHAQGISGQTANSIEDQVVRIHGSAISGEATDSIENNVKFIKTAAISSPTSGSIADKVNNIPPLATTSEGVGTAYVNVASGNGAKGSYVQLIASTAAVSRAIVVQLQSGGANTFSVDIATGAGGSEVVKIADLKLGVTTAVGTNESNFTIPFQIPASTRIAARAFCSTTQTVAVSITVLE